MSRPIPLTHGLFSLGFHTRRSRFFRSRGNSYEWPGNMYSNASFQNQLSSIMNALTNGAVVEITKLVDYSSALLFTEISRQRAENEALRKTLHRMQSDLKACQGTISGQHHRSPLDMSLEVQICDEICKSKLWYLYAFTSRWTRYDIAKVHYWNLLLISLYLLCLGNDESVRDQCLLDQQLDESVRHFKGGVNIDGETSTLLPCPMIKEVCSQLLFSNLWSLLLYYACECMNSLL